MFNRLKSWLKSSPSADIRKPPNLSISKNDKLIALAQSGRISFGRTDFTELDNPEIVFIAVWVLEGEVNNGGFAQYFQNSSSETVLVVLQALHTIGANRTANICRRAIKTVFPSGLPSTPIDISLLAQKMTETQGAQLEPLDQEFYGYPDNLTELLYDFVVKNPAVFGPI